MRFAAYSSKLWNLGLLVLLGAFGYGVAHVGARMPWEAKLVFGLLIGAAALALLFSLMKTSPTIVADEEGLKCYQRFYHTLPWTAIKGSVRAPRVETINREKVIRFSEAWRPIDVYVQDIEKFSKFLSPTLHRSWAGAGESTEYPGCFRLRIELAGMNGSSEQLQEVIMHYIGRHAGERVSAVTR